MYLRIWGSGAEKPLYGLQSNEHGVEIFIDSETGLLAALTRLIRQLTGQADYRFQSIATHIAGTLDAPFSNHRFGKVAKDFRVNLPPRDIQILGRFTKIDQETWVKISHIGQSLLQITNDNWYQTNDESFKQTNCEKQANLAIFERLATDQALRAKCTRFVEMCPSLQYRVIVRLALQGCHETTGSNGNIFK